MVGRYCRAERQSFDRVPSSYQQWDMHGGPMPLVVHWVMDNGQPAGKGLDEGACGCLEESTVDMSSGVHVGLMKICRWAGSALHVRQLDAGRCTEDTHGHSSAHKLKLWLPRHEAPWSAFWFA